MVVKHIHTLISSLILTAILSLLSTSALLGQEQSLLYKIEGNGIKTSYLYGTLHILTKKDFEIKDKVKAAFEQTDQVILEVDMNNPMMKGAMAKSAKMNNNYALDMLMPPKYYACLDSIFTKTYGKGVSQLKDTKPFMLRSHLIRNAIGETPISFDKYLHDWAKLTKKASYGLESADAQFALFDKVSYHDQAKEIMTIIDDYEGMTDTYLDMIETYKTEDITEMYDIMSPYYNDDEASLDRSIHNRTKKWNKKIIALASEKSSFIGIGVGHLGGDKGMIALLRKAGYSVTPVMN